MLEKYYSYKLNYRNYIILLKIGAFYECFDRDALIIYKLFNYKIKRISNTFKCGFPINNIENVEKELTKNNIFYLSIQNDEITKIYDEGNNSYENYKFNLEDIFYNSMRVEKIIKYLEENVNNVEIEGKLKIIESIIE